MFKRFGIKKIRGDNMNKVIMTVLIVFGSLISFSYDSSGVAEYDNLNYRDIPEQLFGRSAESCKIESNTAEDFWNSQKNDNNFIENRLFTKNKDWEGESEYRFLAFKKYPEDIIFSIKDSLEYIVLGVHFSRHYLPSILSLVNKDKIKALGLYNGNYYEKQGRFDYQ